MYGWLTKKTTKWDKLTDGAITILCPPFGAKKKNMHYLHTDAAQVRYYEVKASSIKRPIYAIRGNDVQTPFVV